MTARISPKLAAELATWRETKANRQRRRSKPRCAIVADVTRENRGATSAEVGELVARMKAARAAQRAQLEAERKAARIAKQYAVEAERRARRAAEAALRAEQQAERMSNAAVRKAAQIAAREARDERAANRVSQVRIGSTVLEYQLGGTREEYMRHLRAIRDARRAVRGVIQ